MKKTSFFASFFSLILLFSSFAQKEITNKTIWSDGVFRGETVDGFRSMKDGEHFTRIVYGKEGNGIIKSSFTQYNDEPVVLVSPHDLLYKSENLYIDDYSFNENESKLLLATEQQFVYRHSYVARFYLFDLVSKNHSVG